MDCARGFVAHYQRIANRELGAYAAVGPEMDVAAADANIFDSDYHVVWIVDQGVGAVFNLCDAGTVKVAGGVLGCRHFEVVGC